MKTKFKEKKNQHAIFNTHYFKKLKVTHQVKVEGWARAAMAVAATTKGSIADKSWDESLPFSAASDIVFGGFIPKESNDDCPSLLCDPTLPTNGEVEQAHIDKTPLLNLLFEIEKPEKVEEEEEEVLGINEKGWEFGILKSLGLAVKGEREVEGTENINEEETDITILGKVGFNRRRGFIRRRVRIPASSVTGEIRKRRNKGEVRVQLWNRLWDRIDFKSFFRGKN